MRQIQMKKISPVCFQENKRWFEENAIKVYRMTSL